MRRHLKNFLHRLLGAGGYIVINPAAFEALQHTLAETVSHVAALHGEVAEIRARLAETKSGVSQLQAESGETLSHTLALHRKIIEISARLLDTRSGVSQAQLSETLSQVVALRKQANGSAGGARHDGLHALSLQLDLAANGFGGLELAESHTLSESSALAVHYARLANLVSQHWIAGAEPPSDPYADDDLSPEYARTTIGDGVAGKMPDEPESVSLPWRQLWADPDCGIFLLLGEGNAANHGEGHYIPLGAVFSLDFRHMCCRRAQDPLAGASGRGGSIWPRLGDKLIENGAFRRVLFVPLAGEDTSIKDWTPEGPMHCRTALALSRLRKQLGVAVLPLSAVLWQQGETEANRTLMSAQAYKMHFHDIVADLRANGVFAPVFVACATFCEGGRDSRQNRAVIRQALLELPDPEGGIFAGPDTDEIGLEGRSDGCHFSEPGLARCAELWLEALAPRRPLIQKLDTMRVSGLRSWAR
jgi:Carbohydrate esterase, sialic acid-specific acetylesterase